MAEFDSDLPRAAAVALLLGAWLAAAVWAIVRGLRAHLVSRRLSQWGEGLSALLSTAPAAHAVLDANGRILASAGLAGLLGSELSTRDALVARLAAADGRHLLDDLEVLRGSGASFSRIVALGDGGRALTIHGRPAPRELTGAVVLWLADTTPEQREIAALGEESERRGRIVALLTSLIEAAPFPMWLRDASLDLALVNRAYVRAVEAEDMAAAVSHGIELRDHERGRDAAAGALSSGEVSTEVEPVITDGQRRILRFVDIPLAEGGVAGFAFDVEEMEDLRAELARLERAQRATFDRLSAGVAQFAADRSLIFFNQPFQRMFGFDADWLGEQPEFDRVLDRMRENQRLPESRDFPNWRAERRGWFNAAIDAVEESWSLPGGEHLRVLAQPHPEGGLLLVFEDRTEHMRLASARDTLLRVQAATLDNLFEAVAVFAANGRLTLWNSRFARLWGLEPEQVQSPPHVEELVTAAARVMSMPQRADMLRDYVRSATTDRKQRSGRIALKDGRHLEFAAVPLPDGNALFTILDVTDSRRIEAALRERNEALEAADRVKSQFVANMSYELRTPLTSISGFTEMLLAGYAGDLNERQRGYVDPILEAAGRLKSLIDDILDLSISEDGGTELSYSAIDVAEMVRDVAGQSTEIAASRGIDLETRSRAGAGLLEGDERRLRQSIGHLLSNALSFTPGGGRVMLLADGDADEVRLIVSDSGIGIPPGEQARVFDTFHRAEPLSASRGERAVGLGLPLVRRFVTLHGGRVELVSTVGQGTIVTLHLPRNRPRVAAA